MNDIPGWSCYIPPLFNSSLFPLPTHLFVFSLSEGVFTLFGKTWAGCYAYPFSCISVWMILEPWGNCPWRLNTRLKQQYFWNSAFLCCEHLPTSAHDILGTLFYSFFEGSSHFQQGIVSCIIVLCLYHIFKWELGSWSQCLRREMFNSKYEVML